MTGMFLAMLSVGVPSHAQEIDKNASGEVPLELGPLPPQIMEFKVSGLTNGKARSGTPLTLTYKLMEPEDNFPLTARLVAKMPGQADVVVPDSEFTMNQAEQSGTVVYTVPDVSHDTEITLVWEISNGKGLNADPTNRELRFTASPAGTTLTAGSPTDPAPAADPTEPPAPTPPAPKLEAGGAAAVTSANQPPMLSLTLSPASTVKGPTEVTLMCSGQDPDGDAVVYSIKIGGDLWTPEPTRAKEIKFPVEPVDTETRIQLEVTALDSRGGKTVSTVELVILPTVDQPQAAAPEEPAPPLVMTRPINGARPYTVRGAVNKPRNRLPIYRQEEDPVTGELIITLPPLGSSSGH
jgi:hypothetical protein